MAGRFIAPHATALGVVINKYRIKRRISMFRRKGPGLFRVEVLQDRACIVLRGQYPGGTIKDRPSSVTLISSEHEPTGIVYVRARDR